jgi:hypothetical protein
MSSVPSYGRGLTRAFVRKSKMHNRAIYGTNSYGPMLTVTPGAWAGHRRVLTFVLFPFPIDLEVSMLQQ